METTKQTSKEYFTSLKILTGSLTLGLILFAGVVGVLIITGLNSSEHKESSLFLYLVPSIVICAIILSHIVYKSRLSSIKSANDLKEKMAKYRSILIIRYAIIEVSGFFAIVSAMITNNIMFEAFAIPSVFFMMFWQPAKESVMLDLELNQQEIAVIEDPEAVVCEFKKVE